MLTLYGIKNCDQIKKARRWLEAHQVEYHFHDYRVDGVPEALGSWLDQLGAKAIINRQSSSWRALTDAEKSQLEQDDKATVLALLRTTPTLIKRPLLVAGDKALVGFDESNWRTQINSQEG